jgi:hypothetical protein
MEAYYPFKCRNSTIRRRNLAQTSRVENLLLHAQVELESRLTGRRVNLTGYALALGHTISHIPILEDVLNTCL